MHEREKRNSLWLQMSHENAEEARLADQNLPSLRSAFRLA